MNSLRVKLFLMTIGISAVAVIVMVWFSSRTTTVELYRYVESVDASDLNRMGDLLAEDYKKRGDWQGAYEALEQFGKITGSDFLLLDARDTPLAAYPKALARVETSRAPNGDLNIRQREDGQTAGQGKEEGYKLELALSPTSGLPVKDAGGTTVAVLYPLPSASTTEGDKRQAVIHSVNRSLLVTAAAVMALALVAAFLFARHILRPVEALTRAVRLMEKGELAQRVEARSTDEIGELSEAFNAMAGSLSRLEQLRRNMVSDIAHELRTPLTNLRCQIEALQDRLAQPTPEAFNSLHEETMLLSRLIDDLQDLALAEAGQLRFERQPVAVEKLVSQTMGAFEVQAQSRNIALRTLIPPAMPNLYVDEKRLAQVLRNLLSNALAHTPPGGEVRLEAQMRGEQIELMVKDTGSGIEADHLPYVFERFYRTDNSRARATGGAGLGLAIVKQLVELQGGRVWAESRSGEGLAVFVALPKFEADKLSLETAPRR